LELDRVYYESGENDNIFTVDMMHVSSGTFNSTDMFLGSNPSVTTKGDGTRLMLNFKNNINANFQVGATSVGISASTMTIAAGPSTQSIMPISNLHLRDLNIPVSGGSIPFPSPRAMIYQNGSNITLRGAASSFAWENKSSGAAVRNYYGDWQIYQVSVNSASVCPADTVATGYRCYKKKRTGGDQEDPGKGTSPPQYQIEYDYDKNNSPYVCVGQAYPTSDTPNNGQWYDASIADFVDNGGFCYDYQVKTFPQMVYNDNSASYEFDVQEILRKDNNGVTHLVAQNPRFRLKADEGTTAISLDTGSSWGVDTTNGTYVVIINGSQISLGSGNNPVILTSDPDNGASPCFALCNGKLCSTNVVYIRQNRTGGAVPGDPAGTPASTPGISQTDQPQANKIFIYNYTVGFCPASTTNYTTTAYEPNFSSGDVSNLMAGLYVNTSAGYTTPSVCLRRKVRCNAFKGNGQVNLMEYKLLTVDY